MNVTVTDWGVLLPPAPLQAIVKVVLFELKEGVEYVPFVAFVPLQPLEAVQLVALVLDQVSVVVPPTPIVVGLALIVTVGATDEIVTVADCGALVPPDPAQASV